MNMLVKGAPGLIALITCLKLPQMILLRRFEINFPNIFVINHKYQEFCFSYTHHQQFNILVKCSDAVDYFWYWALWNTTFDNSKIWCLTIHHHHTSSVIHHHYWSFVKTMAKLTKPNDLEIQQIPPPITISNHLMLLKFLPPSIWLNRTISTKFDMKWPWKRLFGPLNRSLFCYPFMC